jgi:hypothetical protein
MANHYNPFVEYPHLALQCMPQEFGTFVDLVRDALKEFRPPGGPGSTFHVLAQNVQGFDAWSKGTNPDTHLRPTTFPTFKAAVARDIFPLITSSTLLVRTHWAMDQLPPDTAAGLMPLELSLPHDRDRRTVQYWSGKIPERLVALRQQFPGFLQITSPSFPSGNTAPTTQELIDCASRLETTSQQLRMISHIYYCAAALREMGELGPETFFVSVVGLIPYLYLKIRVHINIIGTVSPCLY